MTIRSASLGVAIILILASCQSPVPESARTTTSPQDARGVAKAYATNIQKMYQMFRTLGDARSVAETESQTLADLEGGDGARTPDQFFESMTLVDENDQPVSFSELDSTEKDQFVEQWVEVSTETLAEKLEAVPETIPDLQDVNEAVGESLDSVARSATRTFASFQQEYTTRIERKTEARA